MTGRWLILGFTAVAAALFVLVIYLRPTVEVPREEEGRLTVAAALGADEEEGFARALEPRSFSFPADHGQHPEFRTEWWYFTGNLQGKEGRPFGYQLTFFRIGLAPWGVERPSAWGADQIYMAHFALTDVAGQEFHYYERFSRAALDLAGTIDVPLRVWLEDWSAEGLSAAPIPPFRLRAAEAEIAIDLILESRKPVVLQGDRGLSQKSGEPGNASYYYSLTHLESRGEIRIGGENFTVAGLSWLDREWSTSALGPDQVGWDWFSLQLDDGRELMYYQLRRQDGSVDPWSSGTLVALDGTTQPLAREDIHIEVLDIWESPRGGGYPSQWRLSIPAEDLELEIIPLLADQELQTIIRYWEGAVAVRGTAAGMAVTGHGYVELTGYAH
jgi:predicted secreted hydrolase